MWQVQHNVLHYYRFNEIETEPIHGLLCVAGGKYFRVNISVRCECATSPCRIGILSWKPYQRRNRNCGHRAQIKTTKFVFSGSDSCRLMLGFLFSERKCLTQSKWRNFGEGFDIQNQILWVICGIRIH